MSAPETGQPAGAGDNRCDGFPKAESRLAVLRPIIRVLIWWLLSTVIVWQTVIIWRHVEPVLKGL